MAVIGCGFAGAAAALLLAEPSPVGAGIVVQPTGASVLAELGLLETIASRASKIDTLRCITNTGRQVFAMHYAGLRQDLHGLGVHRGLLFETLYGAVQAAQIPVECGVKIVDRDASGALVDDTGRTRGTYDLVVVADGARSELHHKVARHVRSPRYPWGALWAVAPDPANTFAGELFQRVKSTQFMMGFLPSGSGPRARGSDEAQVSFFWSIAERDVAQWKARPFDEWKAEAIALDARAEDILKHVSSHDDLLFAAYHDTVMRRWDFGDMVFIGDAAHAMSPQLGQGTNLALVDASTLARVLRERTSQASLADSLATYTRLRKRHVRFYQWASRGLTPLFQSGWSIAALPRDWVTPIAAKIPWFERQMLLTLNGVKEGPFSHRPLPPKALLGSE